MSREILILILICCVVIPISAAGQNAGENTINIPSFEPVSLLRDGQHSTYSEGNTPITVILTISKIPGINEEAILRVEVSSIFDASNTNVKIILPPDGEVISGTIEKSLDLKANKPESFESKVKFTNPGKIKIIAQARKVIDEQNSWGDMDVLYLSIGEGEGILESSPAKPMKFILQAQSLSAVSSTNLETIPTSSNLSDKSTHRETTTEILFDSNEKQPDSTGYISLQNSPNNSTLGSGTLTVTGKFYYYTKVVGGQLADYRDTDETAEPLKRAYVRIYDSSITYMLGEGYTDNTGAFSIDIANPYPYSFYVNCSAINRYIDPMDISRELRVVYNGDSLSGLTADVWHVYAGPFTSTDGTHIQDIGTWVPIKGGEAEHAFMIYQDLIRTREFIGWDVGSSTVLWYPTSTEGNSYQQGGQIHLNGEAYKSADTVIHEFGHNYMWSKKGSWINTCPSPHYVQLAHNSLCAYKEGWANFLPLAVNGNPTYTWPDGNNLNLETPTWGTSYWGEGDACEGRVAGALWDMYDSVSDGNDQYQFSYTSIDQTMKQNSGWIFSDYWNRWKSLGYSSNAVWSIYQNTINYIPQPDVSVVGNWNGDLITDVGLFRPSNGNWYLDHNNDGIIDTVVKFGITGDIPITGDWNGDGRSDIGVFRPSARQFIFNTNPITRITYGMSTDTPLTGDWNGDGISEIGVFRPSARQFILNTYPTTRITYGISTDIPLTGDWNGDDISDIGVYRSSARQFILNTDPITRITYGMSTDTPLTGDWNGDDISDIGVYRSSARQFILNTNPVTRITY